MGAGRPSGESGRGDDGPVGFVARGRRSPARGARRGRRGRARQHSTGSRTGGRRATRPGQYRLDLAADGAALPVLHGAGLAVLSEESGADRRRALGAAGGDRPRRRLDQRAPGRAVLLDEHLRARRRGPARRPRGRTRRRATGTPPCGAAAPRRTAGRSRRRAARTWAAPSSGSRASRAATRAGPSSGRSARPRSSAAPWPRGCSTPTLVVGRSTLYGWDYLAGLLVCREAGAADGRARRPGPGRARRVEPAAHRGRDPGTRRPAGRRRRACERRRTADRRCRCGPARRGGRSSRCTGWSTSSPRRPRRTPASASPGGRATSRRGRRPWARCRPTSWSRPSSTSTPSWCTRRSPRPGTSRRPQAAGRGPLRRGRRRLPPDPGRRGRRLGGDGAAPPTWPGRGRRRRPAGSRAGRWPPRTPSWPGRRAAPRPLARPVDPARVPGRRAHRAAGRCTGCRGSRRWSPTPPPATCRRTCCARHAGLARGGLGRGGRRRCADGAGSSRATSSASPSGARPSARRSRTAPTRWRRRPTTSWARSGCAELRALARPWSTVFAEHLR